jgi:hypothetical protein
MSAEVLLLMNILRADLSIEIIGSVNRLRVKARDCHNTVPWSPQASGQCTGSPQGTEASQKKLELYRNSMHLWAIQELPAGSLSAPSPNYFSKEMEPYESRHGSQFKSFGCLDKCHSAADSSSEGSLQNDRARPLFHLPAPG